MSGIFISYRGINRSWAPMFIDLGLVNRFGPEHVFQAGRSNEPGDRIPTNIMRRLRDCALLIVLIDPPWLADIGLLRNPADWVRREIAYAIEHRKKLLPVLLDGAGMPKAGELPAQVAPLTTHVALRMRPATAAADLLRLIGEVERCVPELLLQPLTDLVPAPPHHPAMLLRAEYRTLPFRHRPEVDELVAWFHDSKGPPVRLVTGPAGAGKTRLGLHLSASLRAAGTPAGLVSVSASTEGLNRLGGIGTRCLVVIDDAETRRGQVEAAVRALSTAAGTRSRLLLLARAPDDWLDSLASNPDDRVASLVSTVVAVPLEPIRATDEDFDLACVAFAEQCDRPVPPPPTVRPVAATLLESQAAALAHVFRLTDPAAPLKRILELERDYWRRTAVAFGLPKLRPRDVAEIMTAVTLFGATTESAAVDLISALRTFRRGPARDVDFCRDLLRTVLPGTAALNPIQPDLLAEDVVADFLRSGDSLSGVVQAVTDEQAWRAIVVLGRCLDRYPDLGSHVAAFLGEAPTRLLPLAMTALSAVPRSELLARPMDAALRGVPDQDLIRLVDALPQRSIALGRFAVAVTERAWKANRGSGGINGTGADNGSGGINGTGADNGIGLRDDTGARAAGEGAVSADAVAGPRLARLFATRLVFLGERSVEAVQAAQAAVVELTGLLDAAPRVRSGLDARAELAEAYATLALALDLDPAAAHQSLAAGERAATSFRALPIGQRRAAALASVLHNQSLRLGRARRFNEALDAAVEAAELTGALSAARPARYRSIHADVKENLATMMARNGQPREAERLLRETLIERRTLAAARPDAYRPQLAGTLFNLGLLLGDGGGGGDGGGDGGGGGGGDRDDDRHRAERRALWAESAAIFDDLAERWPGRFDESLARVHRHLNDPAAGSDG